MAADTVTPGTKTSRLSSNTLTLQCVVADSHEAFCRVAMIVRKVYNSKQIQHWNIDI